MSQADFPKTLIIAEVGVNHNGDINIAKKLIKQAALAGADIVKFQSFNTDALVTNNAPKAQYQVDSNSDNDSNFQMLKKLELSQDDHITLINQCKSHNIEFLSTAFDVNNLNFLIELNMSRIKIPSGEITNLPFLEYIASLGVPVILSTGMSEINEIKDAVNILLSNKLKKTDLSILHCTSQYPATFKEINLKAIPALKNLFDVNIGYSDHTLGIEAAVAAVALGAKIIEKHITLDVNFDGPDHKASITPSEFHKMVLAIRNIEQGLGDGHKTPSIAEIKMRSVARRSIIASKKIEKGETLSFENISIMRPGGGISPMEIKKVIGTKAIKVFHKNEYIEL
jgi:N,N'-diacetyllegionaminate synthase